MTITSLKNAKYCQAFKATTIMSITYVADFCTLWRENYEMNFIQFRPLVTKCLTFVAAGPGPSWLVGEKYEEFS